MARHPNHLLPYTPALDGIRAFAVTAVVLYHSGVPWLPGGFLGVDVFFVLSGYLITSLLAREWERTGRIDLRRFYVRRARRLLPAALLVIFTSLIVAAIFAPDHLGRTRGDAVSATFYVNNWAQIFGDHSYFVAFEQPSLLQHLWSLSIEEQFYLIWPFVVIAGLRYLGRGSLAALSLLLAIGSALLMGVLFDPRADPSRVYYGLDTHAFGMLIGASLAFVWPLGLISAKTAPSVGRVMDVASVVSLAAALGVMLSLREFEAATYRGGMVVLCLMTAVLIASTVHPASNARYWLGSAPMRWIGERSYGIYLWHWPVIVLTVPQATTETPETQRVVLQILATLLLAELSYRFVELPIRSGHALERIRGQLDKLQPRRRLLIVGGAAFLLFTATAAAMVRPADPPPRAVQAEASAAATERPGADGAAATSPSGIDPDAPPLAIGASVMLGAQPELQQVATVDAAVGRQSADIVSRIEAYRDAGELPRKLVLQLGENGPILPEDEFRLVQAIAGVPEVVLLTVRVPRAWQDESNKTLRAFAKRNPNAKIADWHKTSGKTGLLGTDGTHPTIAGQRAYARLVERALGIDPDAPAATSPSPSVSASPSPASP